MAEPLSPLTSARRFDKQSNVQLAQWLDNDADEMDGKPGYNNHVAAVRAAAERLRATTADHEVGGTLTAPRDRTVISTCQDGVL